VTRGKYDNLGSNAWCHQGRINLDHQGFKQDEINGSTYKALRRAGVRSDFLRGKRENHGNHPLPNLTGNEHAMTVDGAEQTKTRSRKWQ